MLDSKGAENVPAMLKEIVERIGPHIVEIHDRKSAGYITLHFGDGLFKVADIFFKV